MTEYSIRPIALCQGPRDASAWTYLRDMGQTVGSGCFIWYIEGSQPRVLVDAGSTAQPFLDKGVTEYDIQSVQQGLGKLELRPEDIDIVILTHLHGDHIDQAWQYKNARFIVQKAELDFARNPHPLVVAQGSYQNRIFERLNIEVVEGDKEIGDGISVLQTPGHTPGGQSVAVETAAGLAVITGFCCTYANFNPPPQARAKGYEVLAPGRHLDVLQAYDSVLRVKKLADIVLPSHEPAFIGIDRVPAG